MRHFAFALAIFLSAQSFAQSTFPPFHKYNLQYYFIDSNVYFRSHTLAQITDTINKLVKLADDAGDLEFVGELQLYTYIKAFRERKISLDTVEHNLLMLAAYANENDLRHLEADALQALGDFYGDNNHKQSAAIENYVLAYSIYKNFTAEEYPAKQAFIYTLGGDVLQVRRL